MLKHKQIVFATIAVAALSGMVIAPATQVARAQLGEDIANDVLDSVFGAGGGDEDDEEAAATEDQSGDDNQDIDQTQEQTNEQDQEAEQEVDQESSQDETNVQANELSTGANTATVAQSNDQDQDVDADADVKDSSASAASEAEAEDDDDSKHKKHHSSHDSDTTSAESQADAIISATAEATGIQGDQSNTATVRQDSRIHDVDLSNNVAFGDDTNTQIAVPIIDQDQRAANLAEQRAANLDIEENNVVPYGFTITPSGEVVDCFPPSGATPPPFCD
jgi:hypothetical protein